MSSLTSDDFLLTTFWSGSQINILHTCNVHFQVVVVNIQFTNDIHYTIYNNIAVVVYILYTYNIHNTYYSSVVVHIPYTYNILIIVVVVYILYTCNIDIIVEVVYTYTVHL